MNATIGLDEQIGQWRTYVARRPAISADDLDELENHLRDQVGDLQEAGLADDERERCLCPTRCEGVRELARAPCWRDGLAGDLDPRRGPGRARNARLAAPRPGMRAEPEGQREGQQGRDLARTSGDRRRHARRFDTARSVSQQNGPPAGTRRARRVQYGGWSPERVVRHVAARRVSAT